MLNFPLILPSGEEEKSYWDKVRADQERKFSQPRSKKRGTQKVSDKNYFGSSRIKMWRHIRHL